MSGRRHTSHTVTQRARVRKMRDSARAPFFVRVSIRHPSKIRAIDRL
jgi:hypothetical protein